MSMGQPPVFEGVCSTFQIHLEAYFEVQDISDSTKRWVLLVALLPDCGIQVSREVVTQGRSVHNYDEDLQFLNEYYALEVNSIVESYNFFKC